VLDGGLGNDTASYEHAAAGVTVSLAIAGPQNTGGAGVDTLINMENLTGSALADSLTGSAVANVLRGLAGNDVIRAEGGNDTVEAGVGSDVAFGGDGDDRFLATLLTSGNDGLDLYYGDGGTDTADYSALTQGIVVEMDFARGIALATVEGSQAGVDTLVSLENIVGTQAADTFIDSGGDNLWTGGGGSDTFKFHNMFGHDTIADFTVSGLDHDRLILEHNMFERFGTPADLLRSDRVEQVGSDVVIHGGPHSDLILQNTSLVELRQHPDDLLLG
jgi:Ca2+-binding RTX toxin-like protein